MSTNKLILIPELAAEIGLNEALILHQIHYWCEKNKGDSIHYKEGRWWTFNTYKEWQEQFPFWCEKTIKTCILNLEQKGYIISGNFNKMKYDRTKWYAIDYDKVPSYFGKNYPMDGNYLPEGGGNDYTEQGEKITQPIPENTT